MRVIMFKDRFKDLIISGVKTSTIRPKARCKPGDILSLRCWTGKPYRSKHDAFAWALCSSVSPVTIDDGQILINGITMSKTMRETLAMNDGFDSFRDMEDFFKETHGLPFTGEMIRWGEETVS